MRFSAFVSAPAEDDTHPRKMVLNAFTRRGGRVTRLHRAQIESDSAALRTRAG